MTYGEWYLTYLDLYKRDLAPKTRECYARLTALIGPHLDALALDQITPDDVQRALLAVSDAAGTRQAQLAYALLHAVLRRAERSRRIDYNPVDALDKPQHDAKAGRYINVTDWATLRPVIDADVCLAVLAYAGLRRGELLALRWADVGPDAVRVRLQRVRVGGRLVERPPKSRAGVRDVPILPDLRRVLASEPLHHPRALVCDCAPETLAHRWRAAQLDAGIAEPYRLHDLRHTYATRLVAAGCDLRVLQYMLGHSSYDLTAGTYTHVDGALAVDTCARLPLQ